MARSFKTQLAGQIGESLVVAELGRRGIVATALAGDVPDIDILAYREGYSLALQVKSVRTGSVSFDARRFMHIEFDGDRQIITGQNLTLDDRLIFVFVGIGAAAHADRFFILEQHDLRHVIHDNHASWLAKHGGVRPKNPHSPHTAVSLAQLEVFENNWALIDMRLGGEVSI